MKYILLIINLFSFYLIAQENKFPTDWLGEYEGDMIIASAHKPNDTIPVEFEFNEKSKDSIWTYTLVYHSEKYGEIRKDYLIRSVTKVDKVNYELDEQNGIIMELTLMNNCLYGMYEVMEDIYSTTLRFLDGGIFFELYAVSSKDPRISKLSEEEPEQDIEAISYKAKLVQSVYLSRK